MIMTSQIAPTNPDKEADRQGPKTLFYFILLYVFFVYELISIQTFQMAVQRNGVCVFLHYIGGD